MNPTFSMSASGMPVGNPLAPVVSSTNPRSRHVCTGCDGGGKGGGDGGGMRGGGGGGESKTMVSGSSKKRGGTMGGDATAMASVRTSAQ